MRLLSEGLRELDEYVIGKGLLKEKDVKLFEVELRDEVTWNLDTFDEFLAEYPQAISARYCRYGDGLKVDIESFRAYSRISVSSPNRELIQKIFNVVEKYRERSTTVPQPAEIGVPERPVVFIGHGGSTQWRELKDHMQDKHKYKVEAFEVGARAGHSIRDILEEMLILREEGAEDFSNIAGIQQIRFTKGNIKETFGEVLAVLRREFDEDEQ